MVTGKGQPVAQAKENAPTGSKVAQPKKPSQLEQARTTLQNATSAGLPQGVITSLEQEVEKLVVLSAEARPIGAQIDAAKARLARAPEGSVAHARGARQGQAKGADRCTSDT